MNAGALPLLLVLILLVSACSSAAGDGPSEGQMREAPLYGVNHPADVIRTEPINIRFFKKEFCDAPTAAGYSVVSTGR